MRIFQGLQTILKIFILTWESLNFHESTTPFLYFVFLQASIWHALSHYAYDDAIFLAERLFAEGNF